MLLRSTGVLVFLCFLSLKVSFFISPTNPCERPLNLSSYHEALMLKSFTSTLRKKNILSCPECNHFRNYIIFYLGKKKTQYTESAPAWGHVHSFPHCLGCPHLRKSNHVRIQCRLKRTNDRHKIQCCRFESDIVFLLQRTLEYPVL